MGLMTRTSAGSPLDSIWTLRILGLGSVAFRSVSRAIVVQEVTSSPRNLGQARNQGIGNDIAQFLAFLTGRAAFKRKHHQGVIEGAATGAPRGCCVESFEPAERTGQTTRPSGRPQQSILRFRPATEAHLPRLSVPRGLFLSVRRSIAFAGDRL